ncbi:hypothetical protein VUR80DRAFT_7378 [Thermomyces stellatus]
MVLDLSSDDEAASSATSLHALPMKDLRQSIYSLNPRNSRADLDDDDDDDSDYSPDHVLAKRLQGEEYTEASVKDLKQTSARMTRNSLRQAKNQAAILTPTSASSGVSIRRAREELSSVEAGPPAKRARGMSPTPSESGANSDEGTETGLSGRGPHFSPDGSSPAFQLEPLRRDANASFIPASQLLQYGNNPQAPPANSEVESTDDPSSIVPGDISEEEEIARRLEQATHDRRGFRNRQAAKAAENFRSALEKNHPEIRTLWKELEEKPLIRPPPAPQPPAIHRRMKPFQLEGLAWMKAMEASEYKGGILGDEMGLGKTIQAVSLIMSDFPAGKPSLVLVPPVALLQWVSEIDSYTNKALKTFVFHGTNQNTKSIKPHELRKYDVVMMSYNSLEAMYRRETKGQVKKKDNDDSTIEVHKTDSVIHKIEFHRIILDEAHGIKTRNTSTAKACFALKGEYRWCLTGTPLQNVIGEYFSLIQFLRVRPFSSYLCRNCPCELENWMMNEEKICVCKHSALAHVCVFNQEILSPIQRYGRTGTGARAFDRLLLLTDHIMLRRLKKYHTESMELPVKKLEITRQFFSESENEIVSKVTEDARRTFETYVMDGQLLQNYANIFSLIMQLRQTADHPDLLSKKNAEGNQNILECCICESPAEDPIVSKCHHHFCRSCARSYLDNISEPECPRCHVPLSIDIAQAEIEQDQMLLKKTSIVNRIQMENWTSSTKIELLVHELYQLRSQSATHKSIIFSQFTSMLQLIEWRLRHAGFTTVMLDGSMTPAQRNASIKHFMDNVDVECFLVSLKAGGVALNLTEASRVFLVEPWWNPAVEWQSADRCHRIGQARPCIIKNLVIEDSVESRMVLLQEKKTMMIHSTMNKDNKAAQSLSPRDMQFLFRGG